jgi:diamine N-acetyltransferase
MTKVARLFEEEKIELRDILFENVDSILKLAPDQSQQRFVGEVSKTIAIAFAGNNEGYPGFLKAIYYDGIPVGIILIGRAPVEEDELEILQEYEYVYRIWDFFIDKNHQRKGIGKVALKLAFEKAKEYPKAEQSPLYLECHKDNKVALILYESFGFQRIDGVFVNDNYVLIRFPRSHQG